VAFLSSAEFGTNGYGETGGWISPNTKFDTSVYPTKTLQAIATVAYESTDFAFDGSDQMPGEVGAGSFWKEMTAWIGDQQDLDTTLTNIDDSWPAS
jgi:alpha-glucoside transport system substrate-binding protein